MSEKRPGRSPYPPEVRERAVRMVFDHQDDYPSQWKAIESISAKLSINQETLRQWVRPHRATAVERWPPLPHPQQRALGRMRVAAAQSFCSRSVSFVCIRPI